MRTRLLLGPALAFAMLTLATRSNAQSKPMAQPPPPPPAAMNPAPPPPSSASPAPPPPPPPLMNTAPPAAGATANGGSLPPPPAPPPGAGPYAPYPQGSYPPGPYPPGSYPPGPAGWGTEPPTHKVKRWYGWQSLIGVVASDLVTLAGQLSVVSYVGVVGHVFAGPIVHWAHGHVGKGFASLGLNAGLPLAGGLVGLLAGVNESGWDALGFAGIGFLVGYIAAPAIDIAALSTETVEVPIEPKRGARALLPSSVMVVPMLDPNRAGLSLVGQF